MAYNLKKYLENFLDCQKKYLKNCLLTGGPSAENSEEAYSGFETID